MTFLRKKRKIKKAKQEHAIEHMPHAQPFNLTKPHYSNKKSWWRKFK